MQITNYQSKSKIIGNPNDMQKNIMRTTDEILFMDCVATVWEKQSF